MKFTKILILLLGITVMFSCKSKKDAAEVAQVQTPRVEKRAGQQGTVRQGERRERGDRGDFQANQAQRQAKMYAELGLSEAQQTKMKTIQEGTKSKMQAMRAEMRDGSTSREAMRTKMEAIRTAELAEVKQILTTEQFTKYEQMLKDRPKRGGRGGGRGGM